MAELAPIITKNLESFICPACSGTLRLGDRGLLCNQCHRSFPCEDGIPLLFFPHENDRNRSAVTQRVKAFYESYPFPNYEQLDSGLSLREKAERSLFARLLDDQIPLDAVVLEAGCGTGQMSNFLGLTRGRTVFATDLSLSSLRLGQSFKERHRIEGVAFLQMNLFQPAFKPSRFDLVLANGVLHHTAHPKRGAEILVELVKPGGWIVLGLYNAWGRLPTDLRRWLFRLTGNRLKFLDPRLRETSRGAARKEIWFMDQYRNPHESKHTMGQVLEWFDQFGVRFVNSLPKPIPFQEISAQEQLFAPTPRGSRWDRGLVQLGMLFQGSREGGLFLMIGQKQPAVLENRVDKGDRVLLSHHHDNTQ